MTVLETPVWSPTRGGLGSRNALYPGFPAPSGNQASRLTLGDSICLRLQAGDLVALRLEHCSSPLLISGLDMNNNASLPQFAHSLEPAESSCGQFDSRELEDQLNAIDMPLRALRFVTLNPADAGQATGPLTFRSEQDVMLVLALPETPHSMVDGSRHGFIDIEIVGDAAAELPLPPVLGRVREEFRVERASARAYTVKKGEYIQVIDVQGRQCSDFMAMDSQALAQGIERHIDSTVTRTLAAGAYPAPGLHDKFFDQDMNPLLAVVQDTVGRHDTFALACTEYGYAERGYPGHLNCSDNISAVYREYGIAPRKAWPAINFFFNSWINAHENSLRSDEAWSRPGDYVVMRALTDLTCVTTACPDDIDPINGWNPTDIHVRIYHPDAPIRRAVAYRSTAEAKPYMSRETPFHPRTSQLTRRFHSARNYWIPQVFDATGAIEEYWACRNAVTIQDMSNLRKLDICGPDAERLLQLALTRDASRLAVNRGFYALVCSAQGTVEDDGTLFRLAPDLFRWCCGSDESARILEALAREHDLKVWIRDLTLKLCNIAVQGPKSRDLLRSVVFTQPGQPEFENIKWFGCAIARLNNRDGLPFMLTRSGFTGELGYELFCDQRDAVALWDAIMRAGEPHAVTPMGGEALEMLRIEAGLMINGAEFGDGSDPDEAGLGFAVDMRNEVFTGRAAIVRNQQAPRKVLVGLELDGQEIPLHGEHLYIDRQPVGVITSATRSPELGKVIALARVAVELGTPGQILEVGRLDGHMKRQRATVCALPFIDPSRTKARA
uniref:DUF1989 domain-containing protein n=1 Tax=Marinobacterium profundum TaxID=1714300 RepID=UPI0008295DB0|nr:aminomethyltransferase family protein [Marinobacterium profundum]